MNEERNTPLEPPETASLQAVAASLARIEGRLERLEASLGGLGQVVASAPGGVATAVDTADDLIARLGDRGIDVDARLRQLLCLTEKLTEPATLAALESSFELLRNLPGTVATAADVFDGVVERLGESGVDVDERLRIVAQVAERLTAPEALAMVAEFLSHVDAIQRLLESGIFSRGAVEVVDRAAGALTAMDLAGARPVGAFGALRAL